MKQVVFKKLSIQNFLSVGNEPVVIEFTKGINVITGVNLDKEGSKNGVGKSVICDAINFCLFGETLRELKKDHIKNRFSRGTCKVILSFDIIDNTTTHSYVLMRSIEPTSIQLLQTVPQNCDITKSSIPRTNEFICKLINCAADVFQHSILMSVNSTLPFMAQKKVEKRKFIEGVLKLDIFSEMLNNVRLDYTETKKESDSEQNILNDLNNNLIKYAEQQKNIEDSKKIQEDILLNRISQNNKEIEELQSKIVPITQDSNALTDGISLIESKLREYNDKSQEIRTCIATLNLDIKNKRSALAELEELGMTCETCKRPFSETDIQQIDDKMKGINSQIEELKMGILTHNKNLITYNELVDKCNKGKNVYRDKLHQLEIVKNNNKNFEDKITHIQSTNMQIQRDIENLSVNTFDFKTIINDTTDRQKIVGDHLDVLSKKLNIQESAKFVVSEEGVKSFIVKKILQVLNARMAIYLVKLDANCRCSFNEYFEETIIDDKGMECSYYNFSGGERKRIDLAMLFTFQDIRRLQGDVAINISMYDELLDSSLDGRGIELVIAVLKERVEKFNEAVYIITHNSHAMNTTVHKAIELVKYNGITRLRK